jgi:hypothetical protein
VRRLDRLLVREHLPVADHLVAERDEPDDRAREVGDVVLARSHERRVGHDGRPAEDPLGVARERRLALGVGDPVADRLLDRRVPVPDGDRQPLAAGRDERDAAVLVLGPVPGRARDEAGEEERRVDVPRAGRDGDEGLVDAGARRAGHLLQPARIQAHDGVEGDLARRGLDRDAGEGLAQRGRARGAPDQEHEDGCGAGPHAR